MHIGRWANISNALGKKVSRVDTIYRYIYFVTTNGVWKTTSINGSHTVEQKINNLET